METSNFIDQSFDLRDVTRDRLESFLSTAKKELTTYINCKEAIAKKNANIAELKKINKRLHSKSRAKNLFIFAAIFLLFNIIVHVIFKDSNNEIQQILPPPLFILGYMLLVPATIFIIAGLIQISNNRRFYNRNINTAPIALQNSISELSELEAVKEKIINDFTAIPFIPEKYCNEGALTTMLEYIKDKEASNWERCTDLYKQEIHRKKLEGLAELSAEQALIQTELARETRNAARWAAGGAWTAAAGTWWR